MIRWLFLAAGLLYMLLLVVFWTFVRVADRAGGVTIGPASGPAGRPCPVCASGDVYVDADDVCLCASCRASYPLSAGVSS